MMQSDSILISNGQVTSWVQPPDMFWSLLLPWHASIANHLFTVAMFITATYLLIDGLVAITAFINDEEYLALLLGPFEGQAVNYLMGLVVTPLLMFSVLAVLSFFWLPALLLVLVLILVGQARQIHRLRVAILTGDKSNLRD